MSRPKTPHPTPGELEVLHVIWQHGPSTVREVMAELNPQRPRGYTSVMSLMNVMYDKGLLGRKPEGRAYRYSARVNQAATRRKMVKDLVERAFAGSAESLITHMLGQTSLSTDQLDEIQKLIDDQQKKAR